MRPAHVRHERGFTLLEMMIVLVILGLVAALVVMRGPSRDPALDLRATAEAMAGGLRLARAQAISSGRPVSLMVDPARHVWRIDTGTPTAIAPEVGVTVSTASATIPGTAPEIGFAPDGSSTGGRIDLRAGERHLAVSADWLTGRISVTDAP